MGMGELEKNLNGRELKAVTSDIEGCRYVPASARGTSKEIDVDIADFKTASHQSRGIF
jgi:hypothetical protein